MNHSELDRFRLDDRVAVVSGGTGAIGRRLALAFAAVGAKVVAVGRSAEGASDLADEVSNLGSEALLVSADVTSKADADRAIDKAVARFGRVDIIVNAVGGGAGTALYPAEEYPEAEFDRIMDLNLRSDLLPTQAAARAMIKGGSGGRVLHISSVRGQLGINNGYLAYVAAKGAINAITRQQATEWAKYGITVNAIAPTFVSHAPGREPSRRREVQGRPPGTHPAQSDRGDGRSRWRGTVLLLRCVVVRDRSDPDPRRRPYRYPIERAMAFESVTPNVLTDITIRGCNPSYVITSDGIVVVDTPQLPTRAVAMRAEAEERGPIRYVTNTEHHVDHIFGNYFFKGAGTVIHHQGVADNFMVPTPLLDPFDYAAEAIPMSDPDGAAIMPARDVYFQDPNRAKIVFTGDVVLHVGDHTFNLIHTPGHTPGQIAVHVPEERVVFTGDTVFSRGPDVGHGVRRRPVDRGARTRSRDSTWTRSSPATAR